MTRRASVIVPTHNRPDAIEETLRHLAISAEQADAEIIVVDDGSTPSVSLPQGSFARLVRTSGIERSRARNAGAMAARSDLLVFVDDDITVEGKFVAQHIEGESEFGDAIRVGKITLPRASLSSPFGRFRRTIEEPEPDHARGLVSRDSFCTAANMSISRKRFHELGGFDPAILSGEDQDLALRASMTGGRIAYLPEAHVTHRDAVQGISAYGRRHEWGARAMAPFLRRYSNRPEHDAQRRLGLSLGAARFPGETIRIVTRVILSRDLSIGVLERVIRNAEGLRAGDGILFPLYRVLLGLRLFRGFRAGLAEVREAPPLPEPLLDPESGV